MFAESAPASAADQLSGNEDDELDRYTSVRRDAKPDRPGAGQSSKVPRSLRRPIGLCGDEMYPAYLISWLAVLKSIPIDNPDGSCAGQFNDASMLQVRE